MGVARASFYRHQHHLARSLIQGERPAPPLALTAEEQPVVLAVFHPQRFVEKAPSAVYATLLDEGLYHGSIRTMYRLLAREDEGRERRHQRRQGHYLTPELLATGPNQVWSWHITKLKGPVKWSSYSRYVILAIYSRSGVGWMVAHQASAALAHQLIQHTCSNQGIRPGQ